MTVHTIIFVIWNIQEYFYFLKLEYSEACDTLVWVTTVGAEKLKPNESFERKKIPRSVSTISRITVTDSMRQNEWKLFDFQQIVHSINWFSSKLIFSSPFLNVYATNIRTEV